MHLRNATDKVPKLGPGLWLQLQDLPYICISMKYINKYIYV